jgi:glutamine amidotransferase
MSVGVLSYGVGNVGSLINMFRKIGVGVELVATPGDIGHQTHLVLPGVGAFDHAMKELHSRNLVEPLQDYAASGAHLLGICLGMQLLVDSSDEGELPGLGYIKGRCSRLSPGPIDSLRIPHVGWNTIHPQRSSPLLQGLEDQSRFYFVHSYYVQCNDEADVLTTTDYGETFASMVAHLNVTGAQFHPEKSHVFGMALLRNWSRLR